MNDDFSQAIEPGAMPRCPLCDNEIKDYEPALIITAHGSKGLAHSFSIAEECENDKTMRLSNGELADAIDRTRAMIRTTTINVPCYQMLNTHLETLLKAQQQRAFLNE